MFPSGAKIIPNPHGTAPGIDLTIDGGCRFFALPGVPAEMMQMWQETVLHRLIQDIGLGNQRWFYRSLKVFGIGESDVEARLPDLIRRDRIPRVGITVSKATITLRIACLAANEQEAIEASAATEEEICHALGDLVFGRQDQELDEVVHRLLVERRQTLGVIEYGGDAVIGPWLAAHASNQAQELAVGLQEARWYPSLQAAAEACLKNSACLEPIAEWPSREKLHHRLANAARETLRTDWLLLLGPYPSHLSIQDTDSMPTCEFVITLVGPDGQIRCEKFELGGHPEIIFARLAMAGLDYFRKHST
jgi:nicotinamide-nucleotide amidase